MGICVEKIFVFQARIGPFYIVVGGNGRFHPMYDGGTLGSYINPEQAADDLAGGHTFSIVGGIDTAELGFQTIWAKWERLENTR